jgi:hypothetical protein
MNSQVFEGVKTRNGVEEWKRNSRGIVPLSTLCLATLDTLMYLRTDRVKTLNAKNKKSNKQHHFHLHLPE